MTKHQVLKKIQDVPWTVQSFNGLPLYLLCAAYPTGYLLKKVLGKNYTHFFFKFNRGNGKMHYDERDLQAIGDLYYKKFRSPVQLKKIIRDYQQTYKKCAAKIPKVKEIKDLSTPELLRLAEKMRDSSIYCVGTAHLLEALSYVSEKKLSDILKKRGADSHGNFHLLTSPVYPSFLSRAQQALWLIKHLWGNSKKAAVQKFCKEFYWIENTYIAGTVLSEQDVLRKASQQKQPATSTSIEAIKKKKSALLKKLCFTPDEKFVVQNIEIGSKWQDDRKENILKSIARFEPVIEELARRFNLKPEALKCVVPEEVHSKLLLNKSFRDSLHNRYPQACFYTWSGKIAAFEGKDYKFFESGLSEKTESHKELKGIVASPGLAKGKVRICHSLADIRAFKRGEILVASMTRPEYLPAMQKAAGIITDEGGITSHAAIVSRELKIPCIIGTKSASRILKDGDNVKVDTHKGIILIIKNK